MIKTLKKTTVASLTTKRAKDEKRMKIMKIAQRAKRTATLRMSTTTGNREDTKEKARFTERGQRRFVNRRTTKSTDRWTDRNKGRQAGVAYGVRRRKTKIEVPDDWWSALVQIFVLGFYLTCWRRPECNSTNACCPWRQNLATNNNGKPD